MIEDDGVFNVEVTGIADASEGVALNTYSANVEFDVEDTADAIAANATNLGKADEVVVVSGGADVTVSQADPSKIYQGMMLEEEFNIEDNSAAVISATDSALTDGHIHVDVTNTVGASDGAILNAFTADIDFDVAIAVNIAAEVNYTPAADGASIDYSAVPFVTTAMKTVIGKIYDNALANPNAPAMNEDQALAAGVITQSEYDAVSTDIAALTNSQVAQFDEFSMLDPWESLNDANRVVVTSGTVDVDDAHAIQNIYGLDASASSYDIEDTAAALISAGDHVLNASGVNAITVDDGAGGSAVTAQDGALLAGFTADVHFDVVDDVSDLKAVMGQNDAASYLTEAILLQLIMVVGTVLLARMMI